MHELREIARAHTIDLPCQPCLACAYFSPGNNGISREHVLPAAPNIAEEAKVGEHVLPAGIRAAGQVEVEIFNPIEIQRGSLQSLRGCGQSSLGKADAKLASIRTSA
jgi:hypothetical protein